MRMREGSNPPPGELERCRRVRQWIFDALPYLARQLLGFIQLPTEGYTQGGKFWVKRHRDQELEGARNTRLLDRFGPHGASHPTSCMVVCIPFGVE
jgi:hypothetical protein